MADDQAQGYIQLNSHPVGVTMGGTSLAGYEECVVGRVFIFVVKNI